MTSSSQPSQKPIYVSIAAILVALAAVGVAVLAVLSSSTSAQADAAKTSQETAFGVGVWNCTQYEAWVIDRFRDGLTDDAIASLAVVIEGDTANLQTVSTSPIASSSQPASAGKLYYSPCAFDSMEKLTAWIAKLRASLNQTPVPTSGG